MKTDKTTYYNGTLTQYATELIELGVGNGKVIKIGEIGESIIEDLRKNGIVLLDVDVIVGQSAIFKYRNHPKTAKGVNIPIEKYYFIEDAIQNPMHVYEDVSKKELVYVYTHPYIEQTIVKVVVHPSYKKHGRVCNLAKSWGIIHEEDMNGRQYRIIQ